MKQRMLVLFSVLCLLVTATVSAHHSAAMFDRSRTVVLEGTIKEYQFMNPHVWIEILVPDAEGKLAQWSIEGEGRSTMVRLGLGHTVIKPGQQVRIVVHPLRDGRNGGSFVEITLPDGKLVKAKQPQG